MVSTVTDTTAALRTDTTYDVAAVTKSVPTSTSTTSAPTAIPVVNPRFTG